MRTRGNRATDARATALARGVGMRRMRWIVPGAMLLLGAGIGLIAPGAQAPGALDPPEAPITYATWFRDGTEVVFDHAAHLEFGGECAQCHHLERCGSCHTTEGGPAIAAARQVALHGACFGCHLQEPRAASCGDCHRDAADPGRSGVAGSPRIGMAEHDALLHAMAEVEEAGLSGARRPPEEEVRGRPMPGEHTFVTGHEGTTLVAFSHATHVDGYGLDCAQCHHLARCGACHGEYHR